MAAISSGLVTSAAKPEAPLPKSFAAASASLRLRETTSTLAPPAWAKTRAMPLPMPLLAPVTMTDLPCSDDVVILIPPRKLFGAGAEAAAAPPDDQRVATEQQDGGAQGIDRAEHRHAGRVAGDHLGIEILRDRGVGPGGEQRQRKIAPGEQEGEQHAGEDAREQHRQGHLAEHLPAGGAEIEGGLFQRWIEAVDLDRDHQRDNRHDPDQMREHRGLPG